MLRLLVTISFYFQVFEDLVAGLGQDGSRALTRRLRDTRCATGFVEEEGKEKTFVGKFLHFL